MDATITNIPLNEIVPGNNDRTVFDPTALRDLADAIRNLGRLIQPITVRELEGTDLYQIVAGERRYRACMLLGWPTIPAIISDLSDDQASAVMLAENVGRADLDPIDEARAYAIRINRLGWTIERCAEVGGVTSIRVKFRLKLLTLREELQTLIRSGNFQLGYAQILADAGLDLNRQMIAFTKLRDNPRPVMGWFRSVCADLQAQQNQAIMFGSELLFVQEIPQALNPANILPAPSTHKAPTQGNSLTEIITAQITYWNQAAAAWAQVGKPFKKQECEAAAAALSNLLPAI